MVAPKKAKLAEAESEFSVLMVGLNAKKAELAEVESRLAALNAKLAEMQVRVGGGLVWKYGIESRLQSERDASGRYRLRGTVLCPVATCTGPKERL